MRSYPLLAQVAERIATELQEKDRELMESVPAGHGCGGRRTQSVALKALAAATFKTSSAF